MAVKIRLYVNDALGVGQSIYLNRDQVHYLSGVMRQSVGDQVLLINGRDGEYLAQIDEMNKRAAVLSCLEQKRPLVLPPDLWLLFAPIKKARTDFIVEKAAEMGAARICPVQTDFTNSERIRKDRLQAHAVEAVEQCGGTFVPEVSELTKLDHVLAQWPSDRKLVYCDESLAGKSLDLSSDERAEKWAILIGPEGGFSPKEQNLLRSLPFVVPISLGPRILRADTAAVAALTYWQLKFGDWA